MKLKLDHGNVVTERMGYSGLAVNTEQSISRRSEKRENRFSFLIGTKGFCLHETL